MYQPAALQKGDKIGIISPAGKIDPKKVDIAITKLEELGLKVVPGKHVFDEYHQFAGRDLNRLKDFQQMLDNSDIKAIICTRGGYGCVRILEYADFNLFLRKPKWIIGYSDITVFHNYLNNILEVESLHAVMPVNFLDDNTGKSVETLFNAIMGMMENYTIPSNELNRLGVAEGELIGGNLSILYSLGGTTMDLETHGKILFIEDVGEELYHLDRMMKNLIMGGKLSELKALVVGGFSSMKEGDPKFGKTAYEIIRESVSNYSYPVIFGFPAGHINDNWALPFGRCVKINSNKKEVKFIWHKR